MFKIKFLEWEKSAAATAHERIAVMERGNVLRKVSAKAMPESVFC